MLPKTIIIVLGETIWKLLENDESYFLRFFIMTIALYIMF